MSENNANRAIDLSSIMAIVFGTTAIGCIIGVQLIPTDGYFYRFFLELTAIILVFTLMITSRHDTVVGSENKANESGAPDVLKWSNVSDEVSELEIIATTISDVIRMYAKTNLSHGLFLDEMNAKLAAHPDQTTICQVVDQLVRQNISMRKSIDNTEAAIRLQSSEISNLRNTLMDKEHEALTDALTGIGNRRFFNGRLQAEIGRCTLGAVPLSLILIDLDHFKSINDAHGHAAGDSVLQAFARLFATSIKPVDTFARYGGEEFAILLPATALSNAHSVAERLRTKLASKVWRFADSNFGSLKVTASFGVAEWSPAETAASLINRADRNLYHAKGAGRNRVVSTEFYTNVA